MTFTTLTALVNLAFLLLMVGVSHYLLMNLFDWSKIVHPSEWATPRRLRLFIIFLAVGLGTLLTSFLQTVVNILQVLLTSIN